MLELTNREEISVILLLNDPTPQEIGWANAYESQFPDFFQIHITKKESIGASLNRGIALAKTEFIAYADVDDRRPSGAYVRLLATLEDDKEADFTYGDFIKVKSPEEKTGQLVSTPPFDPIEFTKSSCVGPGHFFRRSLLEKVGLYDEQLHSGADFDFQVRAAFQAKFKKTAGTVAYYLMNHAIPSASKTPWQKIDVCTICLRYGIYDKIDYDLVSQATLYRIYEIQSLQSWTPIRDLIPNYDSLLLERHRKWAALGRENHRLQKTFIKILRRLLQKGAKKIQEDGFKEALKTAYRHFQARRL